MKKLLGSLLLVVVILLFFYLMNVTNGFLEAIAVWGISIFMSALVLAAIDLFQSNKTINSVTISNPEINYNPLQTIKKEEN